MKDMFTCFISIKQSYKMFINPDLSGFLSSLHDSGFSKNLNHKNQVVLKHFVPLRFSKTNILIF